jgi:hypothetical protein
MDLCVASHRAVLKALQAFEDGELKLEGGDLLTVATTEGDVRFLEGVCFAAPCATWIGADLVGWLEELPHLSGVGAWWRPGVRAVLRTKDGRFALTAPSQDLVIAGEPATSGVATHSARFLVAHGETSAPVDGREPAIPKAPESGTDLTLRARGTWRTTAVVPWTLGRGQALSRAPREPFGPLPRVTPPPPRPDVYLSTRAHVHTLPPVAPPPPPPHRLRHVA